MTINVLVVDSSIRIRDAKEIRALQYAYPNKFKFTFAVTSTTKGHNIPGVRVVKVQNKNPVNRLIKICKSDKIDVLHTHNFPDTYGYWAMKVKKLLGIPFIHECHDIAYPNTSKELLDLERTVMKNADRIITVSSGMNNYLDKKYNIGKKCTVIFPYPNKKHLPKLQFKFPKHYKNGVYQGCINSQIIPGSKYNHRYYGDVFKKLCDQGLAVSVYPQHGFSGYKVQNVSKHPRIVDISKLYKTMSTYDFAFVGYNNTGAPFLDFAAPNKLFESVCAGLPVLVQNYNTISKIVRKNNLGVVINRNNLRLPNDFHEQMERSKRNVMKSRFKFTMERQAPTLLRLYEGTIS